MKILEKFSDPAYALMRIATGFMFSFHGAQKILGVLSDHPQPPMGSQIWFGGLIELICGLAVMIGFKTRATAFLSSGTMAVAYFQFHWKFRTGANILPGVNQGEMAALYCFVFLYIACQGVIMWGLDKE